MRSTSAQRMAEKKRFLPDERASMITDEESDVIVNRSFEYIIALFEFILSLLKFQLNHHLYQGFKAAIQSSLITRVGKIDWKELVHVDPALDHRLKELNEQISGLKDSHADAKRLYQSVR